VLLTTHVPGFAGILPKNSVRYIKNLPEKLIVSYEEQQGILKDVTEALGILPSFDLNRVKALVYVEGMHDVEALKYLSNIVCQDREYLINLWDTDEIIVVPTGGSTIKGWVEEQYLQQLKLPEFHMYDRDTEQPPKYQKYVDQLNSNNNCLAKLTQKREMAN